jgi:DivIVA domain-containing protein
MDALRNTSSMTTEDFPGGSGPGTAHPAGVVPQPPSVRDEELAEFRDPDFPVALRGYDRDAVDAYVERVNRAIADLQVGRSPQSAIRHALDQVGEETSGILERAHETADGITSRSRAQAAERVATAEREAREMIDAAETRVRVLDADADEVWRERKRLIDDVQRVAAELAELADAAGRRFPPETPESAADTATIDAPAPPELDVTDSREAVPPPPPPPLPPEPAGDDAPQQGGPAA